MNQVRGMGAEVWIATSRPWMRLDNIDPDTRHWLQRNSIPWDYMIYGDDKYHQLVDRVDRTRIVGVVDDLKDQCEEAAKATDDALVVFQPARTWNREDVWVRRFFGFDNILPIIKGNIQQVEART